MNSHHHFVGRNAHSILGHAFNLSAVQYVDDANHQLRDHMLLQLLFGLLALAVTLLTYLLQSWSFTATVVEQLVRLQMFTLLKKADINELMTSAQRQVHPPPPPRVLFSGRNSASLWVRKNRPVLLPSVDPRLASGGSETRSASSE